MSDKCAMVQIRRDDEGRFVQRSCARPFGHDSRWNEPEMRPHAYDSWTLMQTCALCDNYVLSASEAPYCPSCARARKAAERASD